MFTFTLDSEFIKFGGYFLLGFLLFNVLYWVGRFLAIILMRWHIGEFGVLNYAWIRTSKGWRWKEQHSKLRSCFGYVIAYPVGKKYLAWQYRLILISGFVTCVVAAAVFLWAAWLFAGVSEGASLWLGRGILASVLFLPLQEAGRWADIKSNQKKAEALLMWDRLICEWNGGKRPRDWHVWILDFMSECRVEGVLHPYTEYMRAYYLWDKGALELANLHFDFAYNLDPNTALSNERAFFKRIVMGDESEINYTKLSRNLKKTDAFYEYEKGNYEEAITLADKWIAEYVENPRLQLPSLDFDRENMELLKKRAREKLDLQEF